MSQNDLNPQLPPRDKSDARSSRNRLGAAAKSKKTSKSDGLRGRRTHNSDSFAAADGFDTLLLDNWGCDPELSLTESLRAEPSPDAEAGPLTKKRDSEAVSIKPVALSPGHADAVSTRQVAIQPVASEAMRTSTGQAVMPGCPGSSGETPESLAHLSEAALQVIAGNPRTLTRTLSWLAAHYNPDIRSTVARNSNALPETVWLLAKDHDQSVRLAIAEHLESNRDVLKALSNDPSPLVSWRAQNTLALLAGVPANASIETPLSNPAARARHGPKERSASKQKYDNQEQSGEDVQFLLLIAQKATTPGRRLTELAGHANAKIRSAVAENANAPLDALWLLSRDSTTEVKVKLAENYNCPLEIIESLEKDSDQYVVWRARRVLSSLSGQNSPHGSSEDEPSRLSPRVSASR